MIRIPPEVIRVQISNLLLQYADLAEDEVLRADMIEAETNAYEYLDGLVKQIEDAKAMAEGTAERIKELAERKARFERRQEALRELALQIMSVADLRKVERPCATLSIRAIPPKVIITDEAALPDIACKFIRKPDLTRIKELLTDDTGVCAGATMSNGSLGLTIRTR